MDTLNIDIQNRYTYADYLTWIDDRRRELIGGIVKLMTPAPSRRHQQISVRLLKACSIFLESRPCEVYHAPSDVRLPESMALTSDREIVTVVQPDLFVVCDLSKLDDRGCLGAPDFIIEIVSPATAHRDVREKFDLYERNGVREYWIVNPNDENVNVFVLDETGRYRFGGLFAGTDQIAVTIFNGELKVDLQEVFKK